MTDQLIKVLLIEDDPMVQEVNRQFVERIPGFTVVGVASNGEEGIGKIQEITPDLVLLDLFMPLQDGIVTMTKIREQIEVDVIIITAANDMQTIKWFLQKGAVDYIIKPFKFERFKKSLESYQLFKQNLAAKRKVSQEELDGILRGENVNVGMTIGFDMGKAMQVGNSMVTGSEHMLREEDLLPKGLNVFTLQQILEYLGKQGIAVSAEAVAEGVGIARVTARRYLEYLKSIGKVKLDIQYGSVGRPINRYSVIL